MKRIVIGLVLDIPSKDTQRARWLQRVSERLHTAIEVQFGPDVLQGMTMNLADETKDFLMVETTLIPWDKE